MRSIAHENTCEVLFKNVKVAKKDILGEEGTGQDIIDKTIQKITIAKCGEMLGGCEAAIDMTAEYAGNRFQYGAPCPETGGLR